MNADWKWPGSRWWRVDLHAHSPESYDFDRSERENRDWVGWIRAVRDAGIDAVAITDHNTAAAVKHLQDAAPEVEDAPILFPGVELTASDGSHLLLLMDPTCEQDHVEDLLSRVEVPVEERGRKGGRSVLSVEQILRRCGDDALVIGAHVNGPAGLLELDGKQRIAVLRHPGLAAVEIHPDKETGGGWLDGSHPEVGRRLSQLQSSDGHSFGDLGRRFTWVKMTKPELEGLRLALLDGNTSLREAARGDLYDPNVAHADRALESITVHEGKFMGRSSPTTVAFSPWLNAIIGGRGTGKSSLIDFCRKTLRRESELDGTDGGEDGSLRSFFDRRMRVPASRMDEGLLTNDTCLEVVYRKDGERFVLSWSQNGEAQPIARLEGSERTPQDGDIRERFPVRIYSQKQLFALAQDPDALLTVIDDSQTVRGAEIDRSFEQIASRYMSLRAEVRVAVANANELPARRAALADIRHKLEVLERGGDAQALNEYGMRRQQDETWEAIVRGASQAVDVVRKDAQDLAVSDLDLGAELEPDEARASLRRAHEALRRTVEGLQRGVREAVERAQRDIEAVQGGEHIGRWRETLDVSRRAFQDASVRLAEAGLSDQSQYASLLERAADLEREIEDLERVRRRAKELENDAASSLAEYRRRRQELTDRRQRFVQELSSEMICIEVVPYARSENFMDELSSTLGIQHFEEDRQAIAQRVRDAQGGSWDWSRLDEVVVEMRQFQVGGPDSWEARDGRFRNALKKVLPERIDRLALYRPEDGVTVRFRDHQDRGWRSLAQGSPGQQTAALLAFVLGYGREPIILDQPEDDLDSALIYEMLVSQLRETKCNRQVIVVTHNPNIVVHGDAELVLSMKAAASQSRIVCNGGLQERQVRDEVCRVMEGGREAFESRYQRIMRPKESGS